MANHTVRVSRKYTFIKRNSAIAIDRHGEPWHEQEGAYNALASIMAELDAARVVLAAARSLEKQGAAPQSLINALRLHEQLVDDSEHPSEWAAPSC